MPAALSHSSLTIHSSSAYVPHHTAQTVASFNSLLCTAFILMALCSVVALSF